MTHLVQYFDEAGAKAVGWVDGDGIAPIAGFSSLADLAQAAAAQGHTLAELAASGSGTARVSYDRVLGEGRLRPVVDGSARIFVTGTGLTHTGSAQARDSMHAALNADEETLSDSMKIFRMGIEGGKPAAGQIGVQPEWFWKGDGSILRAAGEAMESPHWAEDFGEEPEVAGVYLIGHDGTPLRLGFALANELSDHVMERRNYLFLSHSKLRQCSLGPELITGDLPAHVEGTSRIWRDGQVHWEKPFLSGEANMTHTIANLEHHHFKYPLFRQPGDIHVHVFGTATLSFADGIRLQEGDEMEIDCPEMGRPLRNMIRSTRIDVPAVRSL
jgi:hypothetical protein